MTGKPEHTSHRSRSKCWYHEGVNGLEKDIVISKGQEYGITGVEFLRTKKCLYQL